MIQNTKYYLGIDWGAKKCGLALADEENKIATPLKEVRTEKLFFDLEEIRNDYSPVAIILGANQEKKYNDNFQRIEKIKKELEKLGEKVFFESEAFTTGLARRNLTEKKQKGIGQEDNAEAARIILQSWLDKQE